MNAHFDKTGKSALKFADSQNNRLVALNLFLELICHGIFVAVLKLTILYSYSMDHRVSIEPMLAAV
jgi:hypothetical protein